MTQVHAPLRSQLLRMARVLKPAGRPRLYHLTPEQIIAARHMADAGATVAQLMDALGWPGSEIAHMRGAARRRLIEKYRIRPRSMQASLHRGDDCSLSSHKYIDQRDYRPVWRKREERHE